MNLSLKWKIQVWHALILGVVLGTLGVGFYYYEKSQRIAKIDEQLNSHISPLKGPLIEFKNPRHDHSARRRPPGTGGRRGARNGKRRPPREHPPKQDFEPPYGPSATTEERPPRRGHSLGQDIDREQRPHQPPNASSLSTSHPGGWVRRTNPSRPEGPTMTERPPPGHAGPHWRFEKFAVPSGFYGMASREDNVRPAFKSSNFPDESVMPSGLGPGYYSRVRDQRFRELYHEQQVFHVLAGFDMTHLQKDLNKLKLQLTSSLFTIFLFAMLVGHFVVSRSIRPLSQIKKTATKIAHGELSERIPEIPRSGAAELKVLSTDLNETFSQLEGSFLRQIRFTADASHELRTPLTALLAQIEHGLKRSRTSEDYENILEVCKRSGTRIRRITEQLIELSRYDSGNVEMDFEEVSLQPMLISLAEELEPYVRGEGHELKTDIASGEFNCDPFRLEQVLTNLINNAIQHNDRSITITLRARLESDSLVIEVVDTGKGIQPENIDKLFGRFFQESASRTKGNGKTNVGLGLSISEAIVKAHGGRLEVTSEPNVETRFSIILPRPVS